MKDEEKLNWDCYPTHLRPSKPPKYKSAIEQAAEDIALATDREMVKDVVEQKDNDERG